MTASRDDLLKAKTLKTLGHAALQLRLTHALSMPMLVILDGPAQGRISRELDALCKKAGGRDLATLLAYGDDLLAAKTKRPLKAKLLTHARSFLVRMHERSDAPPSPGQAEQPHNRAALRAWANEHRVGPLLEANVYRSLNPSNPQLFSGMVDSDVENGPFEQLLGDPELERRTRINEARLQLLRQAAWAYLQARAADAAKAVQEAEEAGLNRAPSDDDDSARASLIRRAIKVRHELLLAAVPRSKASIRAEPSQLEDGTPPTFIFTEAPVDRFAFPTKVRIPLTMTGDWTVQCSDHQGPCTHQLAALDALLDTLQNGAADAVAEIVDPVGLPPWSRGLKAIDAVLEDEEVPEASVRGQLSWGIATAGRRPELTVWLQVPTKAGDLGKARRVKPDKLLDGNYELEPDDRHIAELLELHQLMPDPRSERASRILQRALQRLVGHPRVTQQPDGTSLRVQRGTLTLVSVRGEEGIRLLPSIDDQAVGLDAFITRLQGRVGRLLLHQTDEALVLVEVSPAFESMVRTLVQHDFCLPESALPELIQRLPKFTTRVPIALDREVPRLTAPAQRHLVIRLSPRGRGLTATATVRPLADGPTHPPGEGPAEVLAVGPKGELLAALRDRAAEAAWARQRLHTLLPEAETDEQPWHYVLPDPQQALDSLAVLQRADDVTVLWPGHRPWRIATAEAKSNQLKVQVRDRRDWFGLNGDVDVDGQRVSLDRLIDAVRHGDDYIEIEAGQWARISGEFKANLAALEPHVRDEDGELTISAAAADALEALGEASHDFVRSVRWQANIQKLEAARTGDDAPPAGLNATLRDYQQEGFRWMSCLATWGLGACLADDMGLGKTVQALAVLSARAQLGPQLVVAPTSVVYNWAREAEKFALDLTPRLYLGAQRAGLLDNLSSGSLVITSYGLLVRDIEALGAVRWTSLVLDEAQAIKNAQSQRSEAARRLDVEWRLALSGTPVENHLGELWALFTTVAPGLLGGWSDFRERFVVPIERDGHRARAEALSRLIRPFVLRRTKQEVAKELPPRTSIDLDVVLTEAELALYDEARLKAVADLAGHEGDNQARFQALAALTRLRQLACHPRLVHANSDVPSSKLARLMSLVRNLRETGQRALVFSQFTKHLSLVKEAFNTAGLRYLYLDGQTPPEARAERVKKFQAGEADLFLISIKAGGTGLTLTNADTVIHLDPWWNPAVEDQATDRAHRIGQTKPVTVYRLVSKDTIEESILRLHADKRALVAQILDGTETAGSLGTDALIGLIKEGSGYSHRGE